MFRPWQGDAGADAVLEVVAVALVDQRVVGLGVQILTQLTLQIDNHRGWLAGLGVTEQCKNNRLLTETIVETCLLKSNQDGLLLVCCTFVT